MNQEVAEMEMNLMSIRAKRDTKAQEKVLMKRLVAGSKSILAEVDGSSGDEDDFHRMEDEVHRYRVLHKQKLQEIAKKARKAEGAPSLHDRQNRRSIRDYFENLQEQDGPGE